MYHYNIVCAACEFFFIQFAYKLILKPDVGNKMDLFLPHIITISFGVFIVSYVTCFLYTYHCQLEATFKTIGFSNFFYEYPLKLIIIIIFKIYLLCFKTVSVIKVCIIDIEKYIVLKL